MDVVGVRELRQNASAVLRRVEAGERLRVSVNGREVAELSPLGRRTWVHYDEVADLFGREADDGLRAASELLDHSLRDPFAST
ncbi:type II toxin-antitoxin system Phd/YefM family antitoxin [Cellulomonas rhizosphaerae]|uniref:Type II toxin-antitoxin system prevent-host-death family antitoxin n=1 Tax=Cellulomonas rhizosphaerae TaxID=2293719 RepID=A0A413RH10_9CELL|nr:type II toxin-antitoxin system prevent-host-death family antitoxin [Cellulomonas rhizosphaerae]RHA37074.1 type II toxin-antitoxin system prevent-host-death family antitoxin [Cellulomonas rhizosphaerae]